MARLTVMALVLLGTLQAAYPANAGLAKGSDPQTGLRFWEWEDEGLSIRLVQRLPDQTRAFFEARGFEASATEPIARACVFQVVFSNAPEATEAVEHDLQEWQVVTDTGERAVRVEESWETQWDGSGVSRAARLAFRWALLPTRQHYAPGDYNWGMVAFGPEPGEIFDLLAVWQRGGRREQATIRGLECAPDTRK